MAQLPPCSEYVAAIENPQLIKVCKLQGGAPIVLRNGKIMHYTGGFCVVFPYSVAGQKYALRCWHASVSMAQERTRLIAEELNRVNLPYFIGFEYVSEGILTSHGMQPIVLMDWANGKPLKEYLSEHLYESLALERLAESFLKMVKDLHAANLSHGDLQHGNILVKDNGELILVDYDSMYVPALDGFPEDIKGLKGYQHEARWNNKNVTPKADYFSELVIYTSILALSRHPDLWDILCMEDTDWMLFSEEDIKHPDKAPIFVVLENDDCLSPFSNRLKEFINCSCIEDLVPLEEAIVPPKSLADSLSERWNDNGYVPPKQETVNAEGIFGKWENQPQQPEENHEDKARAISNKW